MIEKADKFQSMIISSKKDLSKSVLNINGVELTMESSVKLLSIGIGVLKNVVNFTGQHMCWSLFLIKLHAFRPATLVKRDSNTSVFL